MTLPELTVQLGWNRLLAIVEEQAHYTDTAEAWLAEIDTLINAGKTGAARQELRMFRERFPHYSDQEIQQRAKELE